MLSVTHNGDIRYNKESNIIFIALKYLTVIIHTSQCYNAFVTDIT